MLHISQVESEEQISAVSELFREYTNWVFALTADSEQAPTFQGLEEETRTLPGEFSPPKGRLFLATNDEQPAGCVCLKSHDTTTCELKRLYVRLSFRGLNIGWKLVNLLVDEAHQSGYQRMVLDSHISMEKAHALYKAVGFQKAKTPDDFPEHLKQIVVFMECDLTATSKNNAD